MFWLVLTALVCGLIYWKLVKPLGYWKERGIPYQKPWPIVGNMAATLFRTKSFIKLIQDLYEAFPDRRYNGCYEFMCPVLLIRDVNLIKQITIRDFDHFTDHNSFVSEDVEPLFGKALFFLNGQRWRDMRSTLSPSFTSSKMKMMFVLLSECSQQFVHYFQKQGSGTITVEMKDICSRFANDAIASIAFGLKVDSLEEKDNAFYLMGKEMTGLSLSKMITFFMVKISPSLAKKLRLQFISKSIYEYFGKIVKETIQQRKREGLVRPDMIHLLMEARKGRLGSDDNEVAAREGFATVEEPDWGKMGKNQKLELSDDDIVAQAAIFYFGGFENSASVMTFVAYELAVNPEVQEKLKAEVNATLEKCEGKITYEALLEMKYLDMVVSETLRKWPIAFQLDRICTKDYLIKPANPDEKPFTVKRGQVLKIPVIGIHFDPRFFPNPDKFDPERFSEENKHNINPASYMPFGAGPRSCIASRLALLETKILIFHVLSKFDFVVVEKTPIPLKLTKKSFAMVPDEGFWLGLRTCVAES